MTILQGMSREHCAMHATPLFIDRSGVPHARGTLDRKITLLKLIVKLFMRGVVFMFRHDIVHIELLYCVTYFEVVWTWNKLAVVENAKCVDCTPPSSTLFSWLPCFKVLGLRVNKFRLNERKEGQKWFACNSRYLSQEIRCKSYFL